MGEGWATVVADSGSVSISCFYGMTVCVIFPRAPSGLGM